MSISAKILNKRSDIMLYINNRRIESIDDIPREIKQDFLWYIKSVRVSLLASLLSGTRRMNIKYTITDSYLILLTSYQDNPTFMALDVIDRLSHRFIYSLISDGEDYFYLQRGISGEWRSIGFEESPEDIKAIFNLQLL